MVQQLCGQNLISFKHHVPNIRSFPKRFPPISAVFWNISVQVGSTVVLPCDWRNLPVHTPHVGWSIDSEVVFERTGNESFPGEGYEGRVDVPEDELLKGNCSLVLQNVRVTDAAVYRSSLVVKQTEKPVLVHEVELSVDGKWISLR